MKKSKFSYVFRIALIILALVFVSFFILSKKDNILKVSDTDTTHTEENQNIGNKSKAEKDNIDISIEFLNNSDNLVNDKELLKPIEEYFNLYFYSLASMEAQPMDHLYYFDTAYERELCKTMIDYQIRLRNLMGYDFSFSKCNIALEIRNVEVIDKNYTKISLYENDSMTYGFINDTMSYTSGVEYSFVLGNLGDSYKIKSHTEITGVYNLITETFNEELDRRSLTFSALLESQIEALFVDFNNSLIANQEEKLGLLNSQKDSYNQSKESFVPVLTCDNGYNSENAVNYSYEWTGKQSIVRNPDYSYYDDYGGNCQNYVSQCLVAGGIPMDTSGDSQWYWNANGSKSTSWAACEYFWNYCKSNQGYGLVCECREDNIYCGRPGDIIQYVKNGIGVHSVIISKVIYDDDGNIVDYLINSNTTDKIDCPMSIYGYTEFRLIRIIGSNN